MSMRVAMVVPTFPRLSETFIVNKFVGLLRRGYDVHVICAQIADEVWDVFPQLADRKLRTRVHAIGSLDSPWRTASAASSAAWTLARRVPSHMPRYVRDAVTRFGRTAPRHLFFESRLLALRPDLVHFEFGSAAAQRILVKDLIGARAVVSFRGHDLNFVGLDDPKFYSNVWERADGIHCLGHDLWQRAIARGCPSDLRHALIPPAIDVDRFADLPLRDGHAVGSPERPLRLLSIARLYWTKGLEYTIEAVRHLLDAGICCELRVLGGGDYRSALDFARRQLQVEHAVRLLGACAPDEVSEHLRWADVFVHLSVSEGFCNAVIEAQAAALPVVCSDADGLPENIEDGVTGYVVPRRTVRLPVDHLLRLARDGELRRAMATAGRARAATRYRLDDQIPAFDRFYQEVASSHAR